MEEYKVPLEADYSGHYDVVNKFNEKDAPPGEYSLDKEYFDEYYEYYIHMNTTIPYMPFDPSVETVSLEDKIIKLKGKTD